MGHQLSAAEMAQVLIEGTYITMGLLDKNGHPMTAALTYVWDPNQNAVFIHGSKDGSLMQQLANQKNVSGTVVIDMDVDAPNFTLRYRSVNMSGKLTMEPAENFERDMAILCTKYLGADYPRDHFARTMRNLGAVLTIFRFTPEHLTGRGHDLPKF